MPTASKEEGMAPRGSGHPDLSQRPRREAPGMLTGLAILERELGMNDYQRHRLRRRLAARLGKPEADRARAELAELEARREATLRLLDEMHEEYDQRSFRSAEGIRARAARSPRKPSEAG
jgi:hypothetical protein